MAGFHALSADKEFQKEFGMASFLCNSQAIVSWVSRTNNLSLQPPETARLQQHVVVPDLNTDQLKSLIDEITNAVATGATAAHPYEHTLISPHDGGTGGGGPGGPTTAAGVAEGATANLPHYARILNFLGTLFAYSADGATQQALDQRSMTLFDKLSKADIQILHMLSNSLLDALTPDVTKQHQPAAPTVQQQPNNNASSSSPSSSPLGPPPPPPPPPPGGSGDSMSAAMSMMVTSTTPPEKDRLVNYGLGGALMGPSTTPHMVINNSSTNQHPVGLSHPPPDMMVTPGGSGAPPPPPPVTMPAVLNTLTPSTSSSSSLLPTAPPGTSSSSSLSSVAPSSISAANKGSLLGSGSSGPTAATNSSNAVAPTTAALLATAGVPNPLSFPTSTTNAAMMMHTTTTNTTQQQIPTPTSTATGQSNALPTAPPPHLLHPNPEAKTEQPATTTSWPSAWAPPM